MKLDCNPTSPMDYLNNIIDEGCICGWSNISDLKVKSYLHPQLDIGLPRLIAIALPLNRAVFDTFERYPSKIYQNHYRVVNRRLEDIALSLCNYLEREGWSALATPATYSVDEYTGHLSHRMAAYLSGIGWIGKSSLLVTKEYGAKLRLITVLTDYPFKDVPELQIDGCGDCEKCLEICPVNAICGDARSIDREKCYHYLKSLIDKKKVEELICGLCVKVCDGGRYN